MTRIYIAGPITGVPEYRENFKRAKEQLLARGYDVINPAELCEVMPQGAEYEEYMSICIDSLMPLCNAVALLPGWRKSPGANREYGWASAMDKIVLELDCFLVSAEGGEE